MTRSPIPLSEFEASAQDVDRAVTLPAAAYTSEEFYEFEQRAVWDHAWMCVGRGDQIPNPGDYFTTELAGGERVIVVRNNDGEINVMSEVCQHRGMCITAPVKRDREEWFAEVPHAEGHTRNFKCPYHWWIYDLDGQLIGAPDMNHREDFTRSDIKLPQLAVEMWQGFIFANYDHDAPALSPTMGKADKILENYHLDEMVSTKHETLPEMPFNWKLMVENFMEGYHNNRLHHDLYDIERGDDPEHETNVKGRTKHITELGDGVFVGHGRTAFKDRGLNPTQRALFPPIDTLTDDEHWQMVVLFVPPTLLSIVNTDSALWFLVTPTGPQTIRMSMNYIHPKSTKDMKLFGPLLAQQILGVENFNNEDLPANTATQLGLRSRFAPRGKLAKGDAFLAGFNQWLYDRYLRAEAAEPMVEGSS